MLLSGAILAAADSGTPAPAAPARPDWAADLAFLRTELPRRHKNLFFQTERAVFEQRLDALAREASGLSDLGVALRLQEIITAQGDDHSGAVWTQLPGRPRTSPLPLGLYWFSDGWRILSVGPDHPQLLGRRLLAVNGIPMAEVEQRLAALLSTHPVVVKARLPGLFALPDVLRHCRLVTDDHLRLRCADEAGREEEMAFPLAPPSPASGPLRSVAPQGGRLPLGWRDQRSILWSTVLADSRLFYAQYNRCDGREVAERRGDKAAAAKLPSLEGLFAQTLADLTTALAEGKVDALVFDLRHNSGGASDFGTRFAQKLAQLPALRGPGRVYVILGRRTFSSAILNARDFQRLLDATLVGEATSGTANHYGEVQTFVLPSSRLPIAYSTKYFGAPGGKLEPLQPALPTEMSFADFREGRDGPLEAILHHRAQFLKPKSR